MKDRLIFFIQDPFDENLPDFEITEEFQQDDHFEGGVVD